MVPPKISQIGEKTPKQTQGLQISNLSWNFSFKIVGGNNKVFEICQLTKFKLDFPVDIIVLNQQC